MSRFHTKAFKDEILEMIKNGTKVAEVCQQKTEKIRSGRKCMAKVTTKTVLAKELGCARSTLYYHPKQPTSDEELKTKIMSVMTEHPAYGSRRVAWALGITRR